MKNLFKCQKLMTTQQETYTIFHVIKIIINSFVYIYQDKQMQTFLNKLILQEN